MLDLTPTPQVSIAPEFIPGLCECSKRQNRFIGLQRHYQKTNNRLIRQTVKTVPNYCRIIPPKFLLRCDFINPVILSKFYKTVLLV